LTEPAGAPPSSGFPLLPSSELQKRVLSALVLAALAFGSVAFGGFVFAAVWGVAALAVLVEWNKVIGLKGNEFALATAIGASGVVLSIAVVFWVSPSIVVAFVPAIVAGGLVAFLFRAKEPGALWTLVGPIYSASVIIGPLVLRSRGAEGIVIVLWLFFVVWISDIAAFFVGRRIGGPKLWPSVSPKKTWSGFFGGLFGGTLAAIAVVYGARLLFSAEWIEGWPLVALTASSTLVAECGDLFESAMKRRFGVKDSGAIIPGHGGIMDRLDSYTAAALYVALVSVVLPI
jgi:phosphatidate cytidylyltransferase